MLTEFWVILWVVVSYQHFQFSRQKQTFCEPFLNDNVQNMQKDNVQIMQNSLYWTA